MRNDPVAELDEDEGQPTFAPLPDDTAEPDAALPATAAPRAKVKYERFDVHVPEPGENKIPAYQLSSLFPVVVALGIAALILWVVAPSGIQLLRTRPVPEAFTDAGARWSLVAMAERIDRFAATSGRLPLSLAELDPDVADALTYQGLADGGYILRAPGSKGMLSLDSKAPREPFLGDTKVLRSRAGANP